MEVFAGVPSFDFFPLDRDDLTGSPWPLTLVGLAIFTLVYAYRTRSNRTILHVLGEVLLVVPAYFAYFLVRGFVEGKESEAFRRAVDVIELEQTLGIFWEPDLQEHILRFDFLVNFVNWTYIWGHWPVILFAAFWLFLLHREAYSVYRNAFIISGAVGLIVFTVMPTAPPRFMDAWGFVDTVTDRSEAYRVLQPPAFVNQYAAMPSLHFGWNLLVGIAIVRHAGNVLVKALGVVLPVIMFASIVLTANHYILDGLAGGTLALLGLLAAVAISNRLERFRGAGGQLAYAGGPGVSSPGLTERVRDELTRLIPRRHPPAR